MALPWAQELGHLECWLCPRDNHGDGRDADGSRGPWTHRVGCPRVPQVRGHRAPRPSRHHAQSRECLRGAAHQDPLCGVASFFSRATSSPGLLVWGLSSAHRTSHFFPYPQVGPMTHCPTARPASLPRCLLNKYAADQQAIRTGGGRPRRRGRGRGEGSRVWCPCRGHLL